MNTAGSLDFFMNEVLVLSFSSVVKSELCRMEPANKCCDMAELAAVVRISGMMKPVGEDVMIRISTENPAFARKIFSSIKRTFKIHCEVTARKSNKLKKHTSYILVMTSAMGTRNILEKMGIGCKKRDDSVLVELDPYFEKLTGKQCCKRAYLRGAFLAAGSVSDPRKTYHLEIACHSRRLANEANSFMADFGLNGKVIRRKGAYVAYLKEGENIVDFLNIIGAHSALMELENVRILKEMRNNVNRIVNCETANLDKTVAASLRQIENITFIREHLGFDKLPENLMDVAELRLQYPDASLKELGDMLSPPLGKSGVNHRLRKLDEIAENERKMKGDN